jgi:2,3-dihydroxybiphenyl 1,2-dioxygenase
MMTLQALGYIAVGTDKLSDWSDFASGLLGMQRVERSNTALAFRMDDRKQRLLADSSLDNGAYIFGWEVADAAALDNLAAHLEKSGTAVVRGSAALADRRCVSGLIQFADPDGNRLEAFWGGMVDDQPFVSGRKISGFRTGTMGMGHGVLMVKNLADLLPFYCGVLGFGVTDYFHQPFGAYFLHINGRHHSLALIETGHSSIHHFMVELYSLDDVGQAYDIAQGQEGRVAVTLGRHANDQMLSYYNRSPNGFLVEYGWGGKVIDPATWQAHEDDRGPSFWGHDGLGPNKEANDAMRDARIALVAQRGLRGPVNVLPGNFEVGSGACPWWDGVKAG